MKMTPLAEGLSAPARGARLRVFAASVAIGAVYFGASRGVENFFPFTVLDMYANHVGSTPSRILAVDTHGEAHEVDEFRGWRCAAPLQGDLGACPAAPDFQRLGYVDRSALDAIRERPGDGAGERLRLVRRVWHLGAQPGPPPRVDCPISECRARRR